jgi:hypothetical protein
LSVPPKVPMTPIARSRTAPASARAKDNTSIARQPRPAASRPTLQDAPFSVGWLA